MPFLTRFRPILALLILGFGAFASQAEILNFLMLDQDGKAHELRREQGKAVVLFFTANGCPVARQNISKLRNLRQKYADKGVSILLVNSSAADDRESIIKESHELRARHLPVLKDDTQGVARHFGVKRTGETVVIDTKSWTVAYQGAIDDQVVEGAQKAEAKQHYLVDAIESVLAGRPVELAKTAARGCLITFDAASKWAEKDVPYASVVVPILQKNCVECHSVGNIGSWAMSSHKKVKGMASMIEEVLLARRMPPWDADPHVGHFSNAPALTLEETQVLLRWVEQGAPRGEGADPLENIPAKPLADWPLGKPDIILRMPQAETIPATGILNYRHVEVLANNEKEGWVGSVWVKPGNSKVLHHVIARLKEGGFKDHLGQDEMFIGWAPGASQDAYPVGSGKLLPAKARFDFELHYVTTGAEQSDLTEIGLYLLPEKPAARFESVPVVNVDFEIPPGAPDARFQAMYGFDRGATLHSVTPHMHLRGRWMKFEILFPNGDRQTVCSVPRYDFNWQKTYVLDKPLRIPAGAWVMLTGGYDNSALNPANPAPEKFVHWGDQTHDEMFLGWYNAVWDPEPAVKSVTMNGPAGGANP